MRRVPRQQEFIASRYLLRKRLACALFGTEHQWHTLRIASVAGQRLTWCDSQRPDRTMHLALSHSQGWLLAYAGGVPLGVDVEVPSQRRRSIARLMGNVASSAEQAHFEQLSDSEQTAYFYTLWTQKEAYLKCTGEGLDLTKLPQLSALPQPMSHQVGYVASYQCFAKHSKQAVFISVFSHCSEDVALQSAADLAISTPKNSMYYLNA